MSYLEACRQALNTADVGPQTRPTGCSAAEIAQLESALGTTLPETYREYLQWMGNDRYGIFIGTDCFIQDVIGNTEWLAELLTQNQISWKLPKRLLCFSSHQGYICQWFDLDDPSDDPRCWGYNEAEDTGPVEIGRFSEVLLQSLNDLVALAKVTR